LYLKFLELAQTVDDASGWAGNLDQATMQLLEIIWVMHTQNKTLTVSEAMQLKTVASPSSIHRKLVDLYKMGLMTYIFRNENRRTKYLHPTKKAEKYFAALGKCLSTAVFSRGGCRKWS
jgi:DNA-binding MarR family transcriptional regulator